MADDRSLMPASSRPNLADVATAAAILDGDEGQPAVRVAQRDHRLGLEIPPANDRASITLAWVDGVRGEDAALRRLHRQIEQGMAGGGLFLALLGLILGGSAALGVFFFDGSGRVNAIGVIGILVLLPALFLLPFVCAALPAAVVARIPGGTAAAALSRSLSPGRLAGAIVRLFPAGARKAWEKMSGQALRHQNLFKGIHKWTVLSGSQLFALGFQVAALGTALGLILFTDLAFGWSTTLTSGDPVQDALVLHQLTSVLATPWAWAWDSAVPSTDLILESRYFRAAEAALDPAEAARLGAWWPFMVMSLLVYGVLPRILTLALARARLRAACRLTLIALPGLSPVLHRLHQAHVRTTSDEPETGKSGIEGEPPPRPAAPHPEELGVLINWSAVPVAPAAVAQAFGPIPVHPAGGSVATADDRTLGTRLAGELADGAGIGILVKAWEPPLMEWVDFVKDLRSALPARTPILVLPVGVDSETRLMDGEPAHTAIWVRKIRSLGDPWLNPARLPEVAGQ